MAKSEIYFWLIFFFLIGIFTASFFYYLKISFLFSLFFFLLFSFLIFFKERKKKFFFFLIVSSFLTGFFYFSFSLFSSFSADLLYQSLKEEKEKEINLLAQVSNQPYFREGRQVFLVKVLDPQTKSKILVKTKLTQKLNYGDVIRIQGKIKKIEGFYYFKKNVFLKSDWPVIKIVKRNQSLGLKRTLFSLKNKFEERISFIFPEPSSFFYKALLLGEKREMPFSFKEKINSAGISHLVALSGYHIGIFSFYLMNFLIFLAFSRSTAFYLSLISIFLFVLMTGVSSSCLRAAIMASLFLWSQKSGRLFQPRQVLFSAAFLMALLNPKIIFFDVGFQLSFLATFGLFYLLPLWQNFFKKILPENRFFSLEKRSFFWKNFLVTLSAQSMVLPIIILNFKSLPLVGLISNPLILPFIPSIILSVFLIVLLSFLNNALALIASALLIPFWQYLNFLISFFSKFSFSLSLPFPLFIIFFFLYYLFLWLFLKRYREPNESLSDKVDF